jgi:BirA family biotin operon repressor/biotin-[acetyl-CoA-carboxylase] ligase
MVALQWSIEALRAGLEPLWPGIEVRVVAETASTNTDLLERVRHTAAGAPALDWHADDAATVTASAQVRRSVESRSFRGPAQGLPTPCLLVAERQSAGRGRQGKTWYAEPGASLTFSLAVPLAAADWTGLSLAVGVALADALEPRPESSRPRIALKWPNDLWLRTAPGAGRKLGGVLIETVTGRAGTRIAVIGIGLNVGAIAGGRELASGFASVDELEPSITAPALLHRVAAPLARALREFEREGFAAFRPGFTARDLLLGLPVQTSGAANQAGVAEGVDAQGGLVIRGADGRTTVLTSGEVSVRLDGPHREGDDQREAEAMRMPGDAGATPAAGRQVTTGVAADAATAAGTRPC